MTPVLVTLFLASSQVFSQSTHFLRVPHRIESDASYRLGTNLSLAIKDIVAGLPLARITLVYDGHVDARFRTLIVETLHRAGILTQSYSIAHESLRENFANLVKGTQAKYEEMTSLIFCSRRSAEDLITMIRSANLIQRNILYMFYWEMWPPSNRFLDALLEAMRVAVISNPRPGTYRVYYTQATAEGAGHLDLVNWWTLENGMFRFPVLPPATRVYTDLRGRTLRVPVLHKPPWNFVSYTNKTFLVEGGRDHELLNVLADKLHFEFKYFDPPERSQGSAFIESSGKNKTFPGILGLISEREADLALGDVTITFERHQAVEFTFLTLADSGAFVTHSPSRLNEALALVRPFQMEVWPVLVLTILLSGPVLFVVLETPRLWRGRSWHSHRSDWKLFWDCVWFNTALFLKQSTREPEDSHRVRLLTILLSFAATYVIGDIYSANLTSLLARPGRERPISNLEQLEEAMRFRGYQLLVEKHSSSYNILENGTGVYAKLWRLVRRQRAEGEVESGEEGMLTVRDQPNFAMLGGRETLYFDTRRFGAYNFHLSEKLFTRYSAIAVQIGCPYIESINNILMQLFEAGILTKMTEEEYEKLGDKLHDAGPPETPAPEGTTETPEEADETTSALPPYVYDDYGYTEYDYYYESPAPGQEDPDQETQGPGLKTTPKGVPGTTTTPPATAAPGLAEGPAEGAESEQKGKSANSGDDKLQPISIKMLQGAFYALLGGYVLAGGALLSELAVKRLEGRCCSRCPPCRLCQRVHGLQCWSRARQQAARAHSRAREQVALILQRTDWPGSPESPGSPYLRPPRAFVN